MDRYRKLEKIGEGTYGVVYKGKDNHGEHGFVALKRINIEADSEGIPSTALREMAILVELEHPNVVKLHEIIAVDTKFYLVFEFMDMDLKRYLDKYPVGLTPAVTRKFMRQLCEGLSYCHIRRIVHRDLKPQNILVSRDGSQLKIADFGLARMMGIPNKPYTHEVVTLWYRAPEILLNIKYYTTSVDIWATGCIFAEMSNGKALLPGDSEIDQQFRIFKAFGTPTAALWPAIKTASFQASRFPFWDPPKDFNHLVPHLDQCGKDLFRRMMEYDPFKRICTLDALKHSYLSQCNGT